MNAAAGMENLSDIRNTSGTGNVNSNTDNKKTHTNNWFQ